MNSNRLFNYAPPAGAAAATSPTALGKAPVAAPFDPGVLVAAILIAKEARVGRAVTRVLSNDNPGLLAKNTQRLPLLIHVRANVYIEGNGNQHYLFLGLNEGQTMTMNTAAYVMMPGDQTVVTLMPEQSLYGQVEGQTPNSSWRSPIGIIEADVGAIYNNLQQLNQFGLFR